MSDKAICSYCGKFYFFVDSREQAAEIMREHAMKCEKHPLAECAAEIERLKAENERLNKVNSLYRLCIEGNEGQYEYFMGELSEERKNVEDLRNKLVDSAQINMALIDDNSVLRDTKNSLEKDLAAAQGRIERAVEWINEYRYKDTSHDRIKKLLQGKEG